MRFSNPFKSMNKLAGVAAALMVLPVAVACSSEPVEETGADVTSELPESVEGDAASGEVPGEGAADDAATGASIVDVAVLTALSTRW